VADAALQHSGRRSKRGERPPPPGALAPPAPPAPDLALGPDAPPARGRPASKVCGLSTDRVRRAEIEAAIVGIELDIVAAVASEGAGSIEGQARLAGLEARVWTLRALVVTDVATRVRCSAQAELARASLVRLERAATADRTRRLVALAEQQRAGAARFGRLKAPK